MEHGRFGYTGDGGSLKNCPRVRGRVLGQTDDAKCKVYLMTLVAVVVPSVKVVTWMVKPAGCAISWPATLK